MICPNSSDFRLLETTVYSRGLIEHSRIIAVTSTLSQHAPILTSGHSVPFPHSPSLPCIEGSDNVSSQSTVEICGDTFTSLTDKALSGDTSQLAVSPVKSFEQVRQSEGHKEYGRQHPVRRPWKLMYHTLRWLKPFK